MWSTWSAPGRIELEQTKIRAVLLDPNTMRTKMRAEGDARARIPQPSTHPSEIGPMIVELAQADLGLPHANVVFDRWKAAGTLASA